ncbi:MAG: 16S rRNA (uracil(1498)-N(3))-methyltransferase [Actinomycetales bacterium]|nr:16S rRNA (uracil(1498)-N(3))-methyltransferase [Actinomycetales bacterium]
MTPPVFLVPPGTLAGAAPSDAITLSGPEGRHAATVRRIAAGESITLVDGSGASALATVTGISGKDVVHADVVSVVHEPDPRPAVVVVQALPKGDRGELAVELLTEVGVDEIVPWAAAHCVTQWRPDRRERAHRKWAEAALAAGKQSRRTRFLHVADLATTADLIGRVSASALALLLDETADEPIAGHTLPEAGEVLIVVGPEGGLSDDERERLTAAGAVRVRLGPSVMRTSSAGMAAAAVLLARSPRWSAPPVMPRTPPAGPEGVEG